MRSKLKLFSTKNNFIGRSCHIVNKSGKVRRNFKNRFDRNSLHKVKVLKNFEPAGLEHVKIISKFLKRRVNVWLNKTMLIAFGKYFGKPEINLEFQMVASSQIGHYKSKGASLRSQKDQHYPNNCMFDAVSAQTGIDSNALRRAVQCVQRKRSKISSAKKLPASFYLSGIEDLIGGAKYFGKSEEDAKKVLDSSQKGESHPDKVSGHPRGHASNKKATGDFDSVENYSKKFNNRKTAFLSCADQDFVADLTLRTMEARDTMEILNYLGKNANKEAVKVYPKDLQIMEDKLPLAQEWVAGESKGEPTEIKKLVMVLKHFYKKYDDEDEDPFVLTFYPTI